MRKKKKPSNFFTVGEYKKLMASKSKSTEEQEQRNLCLWIKSTYPKALFTVDIAGLNLSKHQRRVHSTRCKRGVPDLMFQEWYGSKFCGLAIEFKKTGESVVYLIGPNKGKFKSDNRHLSEQLEYIVDLKNRYWIAGFVCGIENAKKVISAYLEAGPKSISIMNKFIHPKIKI